MPGRGEAAKGGEMKHGVRCLAGLVALALAGCTPGGPGAETAARTPATAGSDLRGCAANGEPCTFVPCCPGAGDCRENGDGEALCR
jgi:hypothetical protein